MASTPRSGGAPGNPALLPRRPCDQQLGEGPRLHRSNDQGWWLRRPGRVGHGRAAPQRRARLAAQRISGNGGTARNASRPGGSPKCSAALGPARRTTNHSRDPVMGRTGRSRASFRERGLSPQAVFRACSGCCLERRQRRGHGPGHIAGHPTVYFSASGHSSSAGRSGPTTIPLWFLPSRGPPARCTGRAGIRCEAPSSGTAHRALRSLSRCSGSPKKKKKKTKKRGPGLHQPRDLRLVKKTRRNRGGQALLPMCRRRGFRRMPSKGGPPRPRTSG